MDVIDQNDGVAHHQTAEADDPDKSGKAERIVSDEKAEGSAWNGERYSSDYDECVRERTELEQEDEKDRNQADEQGMLHLREGFVLVLILAAIFNPVTRGQRKLLDLLLRIGEDLAGKITIGRKCAHSKSANSVA